MQQTRFDVKSNLSLNTKGKSSPLDFLEIYGTIGEDITFEVRLVPPGFGLRLQSSL